MLLRKKKNKVRLSIEFNKKTKQLVLVCKPPNKKPTEIIQILMLAINVVDEALKKELGESRKKEKKISYIG